MRIIKTNYCQVWYVGTEFEYVQSIVICLLKLFSVSVVKLTIFIYICIYG